LEATTWTAAPVVEDGSEVAQKNQERGKRAAALEGKR
jgi:hypothetical protein